ncbi:ABC transporter substrate-binding protein [Colwellia echini]|uniref:Carbohydrate ABC transporter substrate-binding protein n=1 Tax=Colwellia echini TaxID=1982103 RepID=A0ABY3N1T8_9GAMM|nr:ABC transporter substrate-binding protein [Colwellia echini]TYK67212.1 carbohydrate ABC transporter substrate-binding protein [Colwellia echini]
MFINSLRSMIKLLGQVYCLIALFFLCAVNSVEQPVNTSITIAIHGDGVIHREEIQKRLDNFEKQYPNIDIDLYFVNGMERYSTYIDKWLNGSEGPDVIGWVGGSRVKKYVSKGLIKDLTPFWKTNKNLNLFPQANLDSVRVNEKFFGIPKSSAIVAFYYRKSLIKNLKIEHPKTWQQLLDTCNILHEKKVTMFALGTKGTEWVIHGWFDYLTLRLHGIDFYKQLASGQSSYLDVRVKETLEHLKSLVDNNCFNHDHANHSTWDVFPTIIRGQSAMILGEGLPQTIPFNDYTDIGITEFVNIKPEIPNYTVVPVSTFVVPHYTEITPEITTLLNFLTSEGFQKHHQANIRHLPTMITTNLPPNELVKSATEIIQNSPGSIQYFDREVDIRFSSKTPKIFVNFIDHLKVDETMQTLEELRLSVFGGVEVK